MGSFEEVAPGKGKGAILTWAKNQFNYTNGYVIHTVIHASLTNWRELYIACEYYNQENGIRFIYCKVVLIDKYRPGSVMTKIIDETGGPYYYNCPKIILKKLSPVRKLRVFGLSYKWAKQWRQKVQEQIELKSTHKLNKR